MKYCICIRGLHYSNTTNIIDYKKSLDNYKQILFQPLLDEGHELFIFLLTYDTPIIKQLISDYNAKDTYIIPQSEMNSLDNWNRQKYWHLQSVNMIEQYEQKHSITFDYILNTRFDLIYTTRIFSNINFEKINIIVKHLSGNCDDNFFLFPRKHLNTFKNAVDQLNKHNQITHALCRYINDDDIHYICPIPEKDWQEVFSIARVKI